MIYEFNLSARRQQQYHYVWACYLQMVQLHSRIQVVDLQAEEIKYTPKDGDTITRTVTTTNNNTDAQTATTSATETIQIPSGTRRTETLELQASDRIVNE